MSGYSGAIGRGFTIVELLIVIVVIGVLAALVVVAYNSVQVRALNAARYTEMKAWVRLFQQYQAQEGHMPTITAGWYCLGSGFPKGYGGEARCRDYNEAGSGAFTDNISYPESENTALMTEIAKTGRVSAATKNPTESKYVGPYVDYNPTWGGNVNQVFSGKTGECPGESVEQWASGSGTLICSIAITD